MASFHNVYHSEFKIAFKLGLLSSRDISLIPRSSQYRFRNADYSNLVGCEFSQFLHSHHDLIAELMRCRKTLAVCKTIISIKHTLVSIYSAFTSNIHALGGKHPHVMRKIVSAISRSKDSLGLERAASFVGISRSTFFA